MLAWGGAAFAQSLSRLGLVDEYRLIPQLWPWGRGSPVQGSHRAAAARARRRADIPHWCRAARLPPRACGLVTNHNYVDEMIQEMTVGGDVLGAGSAEYESARRSQIARFDGVRPRVVVRCRVPEDVAQAPAFAREEGLHVALRSGGHCFAGRSSTTGVVIDLSGMNEVLVSDGTVTVGAGARSAEVYDALAADDRTIAAGWRAVGTRRARCSR
jgi:hypothetical protein